MKKGTDTWTPEIDVKHITDDGRTFVYTAGTPIPKDLAEAINLEELEKTAKAEAAKAAKAEK